MTHDWSQPISVPPNNALQLTVKGFAPIDLWYTDRLRFIPRVPWLGLLFALVFRGVFLLRHRNLRRKFGAAAA